MIYLQNRTGGQVDLIFNNMNEANNYINSFKSYQNILVQELHLFNDNIYYTQNNRNYCFYRVSAEDNKIYNYSVLYRVKNADSAKDAFSRLISEIEDFEFVF